MLEIIKATCGYRKDVILDHISVTLNRGEILSIIGANGIGKTTLFKSILGHIKLMSGQILVDDIDINTLNSMEKAKLIAYVPQVHIPPFPFKVIDVVAMGRTVHMKFYEKPSKLDMEIAMEALRMVHMPNLWDKIYTQISGGERQLVLIARAIAQESKILIMDEPMANLDFGNQSRIMEQIRQLAALGLSIIYTTHNPEHTFLCSSKVLAIKNKNDYILGSATEIITKELLKEIYQIETEVKEIELENKKVQICIPV